ncbi:MAG: hypothetical protein HZB91_07390 [Elusimicrobia bacterium]|nr:hypothetical protein [Elusimicrobiota bacterium]
MSIKSLQAALLPALSAAQFRRFLLVVAAAFALRGGAAVLSESLAIFPGYYYIDPGVMDRIAWKKAEGWRRGETMQVLLAPSHRSQVFLLANVYYHIGHHPVVVKLLYAGVGALAIGALAAAFSCVFGAGPALLAALVMALWPSHVFYTSQLYKEGPVFLTGALTLWGGVLLLASPPGIGSRRLWPGLALMGLGLFLTAFLRAYLMLGLAVALGLTAAWRWASKGFAQSLFCVLIIAASVPPMYKVLSAAIYRRQAPAASPEFLKDPGIQDYIVPATYDYKRNEYISPYSPRSISEFRRNCQFEDRKLAKVFYNRTIGTQLFPDEDFETWGDVLVFLPKAAFYTLFMPLPGLYPMEGKIGRMLAAAENVLLLALSLCAVAGILKGPKSSIRMAPILLFLGMAAGSAFFEFDLGSASRHKLFTLSLLLPFAAEVFLRRTSRSPA